MAGYEGAELFYEFHAYVGRVDGECDLLHELVGHFCKQGYRLDAEVERVGVPPEALNHFGTDEDGFLLVEQVA